MTLEIGWTSVWYRLRIISWEVRWSELPYIERRYLTVSEYNKESLFWLFPVHTQTTRKKLIKIVLIILAIPIFPRISSEKLSRINISRRRRTFRYHQAEPKIYHALPVTSSVVGDDRSSTVPQRSLTASEPDQQYVVEPSLPPPPRIDRRLKPEAERRMTQRSA